MGNPSHLKNILVTSEYIGEKNLDRLSEAGNVYASWKMDEKRVEAVLPDIDILVVFLWPMFLSPENLEKMKRLQFLQSMQVGVNHVPFAGLGRKVMVASNSGAYSLEVGEHAWGLVLAAAKKVAEHHIRIKEGAKELREFSGEAAGIMVLKGKTLGVIGYGGIGSVVAGYAKAFGMNVLALTRTRKDARAVRFLRGKAGLCSLLRQSDVAVLSLPLTNSTFRLIGKRELSLMKGDAILVNIARGDLVDQDALYSQLKSHPNFRYATDVWWFKNGQETLEAGKRFAALQNFVGTPHMSGPTAAAAGKPGSLATDNVLRYIWGKTPQHIVDRAEYTATLD